MGKVTTAVVSATLGVALGLGIGQVGRGTEGHPVTPSPAALGVPVPGAPATVDDGSTAARQVTGWQVIDPGTPAARYWARHGARVADPETRCEAALRVQWVRGSRDPLDDRERLPLWRFECQGVDAATRDSMTIAAVRWGATHREGEG